MKKKLLMSILLLAIIGTSAVLAQQPTQDKLKWGSIIAPNFSRTSSTGKVQLVEAANKSIRGEVVIPGTYNDNRVDVRDFKDCPNITSVILLDGVTAISRQAFVGCTGITSVTIPANIDVIEGEAFKDSSKLTSVTFQGTIKNNNVLSTAFPGDLIAKFKAGGAGTYTRPAGSNTWTKVDGVALCPYCGQPLPAGFKAP